MPQHGQNAALQLAGAAAAARGDLASAIGLLQQALAAEPDHVSWLRDLATLHFAREEWPQAIEILGRESALAPLDRRGLELLGLSWLNRGEPHEAARILSHAAEKAPESAGTHLKLGRAWRQAGDYNAALDAFTTSLALDPRLTQARWHLANLYSEATYDHLALQQWEIVSSARPASPEMLLCLSRARFQTGDVNGALDAAQSLLNSDGMYRDFHSEVLGMRLHSPHESFASIRAAHEAWTAAYCSGTPPCGYANIPDPDRPLRIGYVCGEFKRGPLFGFLIPILRHHQSALFETTCYQSNPLSDDYTAEYRRAARRWREAASWTDDEFVENVRQDEIDILVDLSGHYDHNRLTVMARRPAPIQVSLPSYPATTGVAEIDYIFSDRWVCPAGREEQYTEHVYFLPSGYLPYRPPHLAPAVTLLPAVARGRVRFGVFQRPAKFTPLFWDAVAEILRRHPASDLLVHYPAAELDDRDSQARQRFRSELGRRGVESDRLTFLGPLPREANLAAIGEVDVALDTFPYNGQTTTCECLWMGVPVVTLAGEAHVARVGFELLDRVGLGNLVAQDVPKYVSIALRLAGDINYLSELRGSLRPRMEASVLMDHRKVTGEIEEGFRWMWRRWCRAAGMHQERQMD